MICLAAFQVTNPADEGIDTTLDAQAMEQQVFADLNAIHISRSGKTLTFRLGSESKTITLWNAINIGQVDNLRNICFEVRVATYANDNDDRPIRVTFFTDNLHGTIFPQNRPMMLYTGHVYLQTQIV